METVFFLHKDGTPSSTRTTVGNMSFTSYWNSPSRGGITIRTNNFTSRMNHSGQSIGTAFRTGNNITYFGGHGSVNSHITSF